MKTNQSFEFLFNHFCYCSSFCFRRLFAIIHDKKIKHIVHKALQSFSDLKLTPIALHPWKIDYTNCSGCMRVSGNCTWEHNGWRTWIDKLTLYSRHWCACVTVCVINQPLMCSPPGLPDIISHYPHHSSNAAGVREHGCFVGFPPTSCLPTFFRCSFTRLHCGAFDNLTLRRARGDANVYILGERANAEKENGKNCRRCSNPSLIAFTL